MPAHERYVSEAITSVLDQTYEDLELVVVNDGSHDKTGEIAQGFSDARIRYFEQTNRGAHHAINRGIAEAKGSFLAIINSDDRFHPGRIERLIGEAARQDKQFLLSDINLIDEHSALVDDPAHWSLGWYEDLKREFTLANSPATAFLSGNYAITTSNFFFSRECARLLGKLRPYQYIHDYEYAFRAALRLGPRFGFLVGDKLLDYRLHGSNAIRRNPLKANVETFFFLRTAINEVYGPDLGKPLAHLDKIKRYITKLDGARKWAIIDGLDQECGRLRGELARLQSDAARLQSDAARLHGDLARTQAVAAETAACLDVTQQQLGVLERSHTALQQAHDHLQRDHAVLLASRSLALGLALTFPFRLLKSRMNGYLAKRTAGITSVKDIDTLRQVLGQCIEPLQVISFDIFDTVLEREVDPPDHVKLLAARRLSDHLATAYSRNITSTTILGLRHRIEGSLRQRRVNEGLDHEYLFSDLADRLAIDLLGRRDHTLAGAIVAEELRAETAVLYPKPGITKLLTWIKGQGKRVIAVSDMYLDREHLQAILADKGLAVYFDAIYVSSETGKGKYSGRLFRHVLEAEGITPHAMVHVGDNHHSDHASPTAMGIRAVHLDDTKSNRRRLLLRGYAWLTAKNPYWRGRHLLQLIRTPPRQDFFYDFGFSFLGPVYSAFILGVIEKARAHAIPRLFFLAREGHLFLRIFHILAPRLLAQSAIPETVYLYVSRKSAAPAAMYKGLDYEMVLAPLHNPKQRGLYSLCRTFDLPPEQFDALARKHGYESVDQPIPDWDSDQFRRSHRGPRVPGHRRPQRALPARATQRLSRPERLFQRHQNRAGGHRMERILSKILRESVRRGTGLSARIRYLHGLGAWNQARLRPVSEYDLGSALRCPPQQPAGGRVFPF